MADPIEVVKAVLAAAAPVTTLVSDRISPNPLAQNEPLPAIVLTVVGTVPNWNLRGDSNLDEVRVQVDSYGVTATAAAALSDAVRAALSAADRVLNSEITDYDPSTEAHVVSQDYFLWIHPTA
jgi:hypothetical protein